MTKTTKTGFIRKGKLHIFERDTLASELGGFPDCDVLVTVEKDSGTKTRKQQGYYWSTLVPHTLIILRDICGYSEYKTNGDAHEFLKYMHNPVYRPDPANPDEAIRYGGTTTTMSKEQKMKYIDAIIMDGWDKWVYSYPPPKKNQDKYYFTN